MKKLASIFIAVGFVLVVVCFYLTQQQIAFLDTSLTAEGVVIDHQLGRKRKPGKARSLYPVVEYMTKKNEKIVFVSSSGSSSGLYDVGTKINVIYDEMKPSDAQIEGFMNQWGASLIVGFISGSFILVGFFVLKKSSLGQ